MIFNQKKSNLNTHRFTKEDIYSKAKEIRELKKVYSQDIDFNEVDLKEAEEALLKEQNKFQRLLILTGFEGKKLWDFMPLLIMPFLLALVAFQFQSFLKDRDQDIAQQKITLDKQIADDKIQQGTLDNYLKEMSELIDRGLLSTNRYSNLYAKAQFATINSLKSLDPVRQKVIIQYLQTFKLDNLDGGRGILFEVQMPGSKLKKADLSGAKFVDSHLEVSDFTEANLIGARFQKTYLQSSNFTKSELFATYFENTNLESSDFTDANLQSAIIIGTDLQEVTLIGADLSEAILLNVDMSKTKGLLVKQLQNRKQPFICKVTLPSSIKINPNRDCKLLPNQLLKRDPMSYKTLKDAEDYVNK